MQLDPFSAERNLFITNRQQYTLKYCIQLSIHIRTFFFQRTEAFVSHMEEFANQEHEKQK